MQNERRNSAELHTTNGEKTKEIDKKIHTTETEIHKSGQLYFREDSM